MEDGSRNQLRKRKQEWHLSAGKGIGPYLKSNKRVSQSIQRRGRMEGAGISYNQPRKAATINQNKDKFKKKMERKEKEKETIDIEGQGQGKRKRKRKKLV